MMEQAQADRGLTAEEQLLDQLQQATRKIEKLEKVVGALAVTNFLTQHEDGDEEVREQSVEVVNKHAYRFKRDWKTEKQIAELESKKWELDQEIQNLKWGTVGKTMSEIGLVPTVALEQALTNRINAAQQTMVNTLNQFNNGSK